MQDIYKSIYEQNLTNEVKVFGHEESLISVEPHPAGDGHKLLYKFPNGYGASVIRFQVVVPFLTVPVSGSYGAEDGLWEVVRLDQNNEPIPNSTTEGFLSPEDVHRILDEVETLHIREEKEDDDMEDYKHFEDEYELFLKFLEMLDAYRQQKPLI